MDPDASCYEIRIGGLPQHLIILFTKPPREMNVRCEGMALPTLGIGLLPNYAKLGIWAPVLLLLLRILQGIASVARYRARWSSLVNMWIHPMLASPVEF